MRDIIADILKEINFIRQKLSRYRFQRLSHFEPFIIFSQKKKKNNKTQPTHPQKPLVSKQI